MPVIAVRVPKYFNPVGVLLLKMPNLLLNGIALIAYFWLTIMVVAATPKKMKDIAKAH